MADDWISYRERPEWADIEPVQQDDGPHPVVHILYTSRFKEVMDYFRAVVKRDERSIRALALTADAIVLNSANYTVWHYRRLVLEALGTHYEEDLNFLETIGNSSFKNYQFWQHRRWVATKRGKVATSEELNFTEEVLEDDAKNYHAWSHRQWVLLEFGSWERELDYCTKLLKEDVYNNSAWNQRYFVITRDPSRGGLKALLESEVKYSVQAIQEAPSNESAWKYLRGLFKDDKSRLVAHEGVIEVCLKTISEGNNAVHALSLLLDLLGFGFEASEPKHIALLVKVFGLWSSPTDLAGLVCRHLGEVDAIRARYWAWRQSLLPRSAPA